MTCFIDEIKGIIVDPIDPDTLKNGKLVFLSNFYKGAIIPKSSPLQANQILCCTRRTMQMLRNVGVKVPIWQELEIGGKYDIDFSTEDHNESRPVELTVTVIDAGHCTGSCMFLFETVDKSVLYTSEFRLSTFEISRIRELRDSDDERKRLDALYVDCSFIKHESINLPTLKSSVETVSTDVENFLSNNQNGKVYVYSFEAAKQYQLIRGLATCIGKRVYIHSDIVDVDSYKDIPHMCHYITNEKSGAAIHLYQNDMSDQPTCVEGNILKVILEDKNDECNNLQEVVKVSNNCSQIRRSHSIHATSEEICAMVKLYKPKRVSPCYIPSGVSMEEAEHRLNELVLNIKPSNDKTLNCKFDGFIDGIDYICADRFDVRHIKKCSAFFLSHCHSDHMKHFSELSSYPDRNVYCTGDTEKILKNIQRKLKLSDSFFDCIKVLDVSKTHKIHVPAPNGSSSRTSTHVELQVTPINANHCLGACMFLFEIRKKRVLYTGDFRFYESQLPQIKELHESDGTTVKPIDLVYLDTSFFNQVNHTKDFPTVEESLMLITESIDEYRRVPDRISNWIVLKQTSYLGTEEILIGLSRKYETKFHLNDESCDYYKGFEEIESCITLKSNETIFHFCDKQTGTPVKNKCVRSKKYLLILPTALHFAKQLDFNHKEKTDSGVIRVAFSKHCSHKELDAFLRYFKPKRAISCANSDDNESQPEKYAHSELQLDLDKLIDEINHSHDGFPHLHYPAHLLPSNLF